MSANGPGGSLRPPGQNGPQNAKPSSLTPEQRSYLLQYLNSTIANELPAETQNNIPSNDVAVANDPPDAEHPPTPTNAAPKPCYMRKISVASIAGWPELFITLQLWLIRNGFTYQMDHQTNGHDTVFVFEGSKEGRKAAKRFYKAWNGRAHTSASDSPVCAMKMMVVKDIVSPREQ
ncbi:hypothetical protein DBV05_g10347 [Lasiodiplodia theobromae]|uniref:Uncharacterized protein n=1 Tax=Lasiodiplodia theobromae TaxID=45133 RepID=A0A5N5D051_9PEZI|nr:hypothetical protein DBV05_g10347 [Lasiodiplodia theobromae]